MTVALRLAELEIELGALVEAHARGRSAGDLSPYHDDPVRFARDVLHAELWSKQVALLELIRDRRRVCGYGGIATGKDFAIACAALWWFATRPGSTVLITGPTERQVKEIAFGEIARLFHGAAIRGERYQTALRGADGSLILGFVSNEASRMRGYHARGGVLAILTEGQGCEPFAYDAMTACAAGEHDKVVVIGNPIDPSGPFYQATTSPTWATLQISGVEHPNVIQQRPVIPGAISLQTVADYERDFGRGSPKFIADILGQFPLDVCEGLIPRSWCEQAAARWRAAQPPTSGRDDTILAVDPARYGSNETAVCVRQGPIIRTIVTWQGFDLMQSVARIEQVGTPWGVTPKWRAGTPRTGYITAHGTVIVDTVGVGGGLADRLRELGYSVTEFNSGATPTRSLSETTEFFNLRAQAYWSLREQLQRGTLCLPDDPKLFDELVSTTWEETPQGEVRITAKEKLRDKLGRSPDRADSVVMSCIAADAAAEARAYLALNEWSRQHAVW